jgi:hypothetical protein
MTDECKWCTKVKGEEMPENQLELISEITEFNDLHTFMEDEQLDKALELVVKLIVKPEVPSAKAPALIVELQALSTKFAILAAYYATIASGPSRSDAAHKKNLYFSTKEAINKMVDALKYAAKSGVEY